MAREETHVYWLHRALLDVGAAVPADAADRRRSPPAALRDLAAADARANAAFVEKWAPRVSRRHARPPSQAARGHPRRGAGAPPAVRAGGRGPHRRHRHLAARHRAPRRRPRHPLGGVGPCRPGAGRRRPRVAIALGSNLGDRAAHLDLGARGARRSPDRRCAPRRSKRPPRSRCPTHQPDYLNAVAVGRTDARRRTRCSTCCSASRRRAAGRVPARGRRARSISTWSSTAIGVIDDDRLTVPHPRFLRSAVRARAAGRAWRRAGASRSSGRTLAGLVGQRDRPAGSS